MRFSLTMILGLSLVLLSGVARAETPTSFEINHSANGDFFGESFSLNYTFGTTDFLDGNVTDQAPGAFPVEVNSGLGSGGFDFEVVLDYTDYGIGTFGGTSGPVTGSFVGIGQPITDVFVTDPGGIEFGNFSTDGSSVFFDYTIADVLSINEGPVTISFSTQSVPEPGSAVIIGLAGLCLMSRRRR